MATTLTGANQTTEWWDLRGAAESVCFLLTGDFVDAVGIHYSNNEDVSKGTDYTVGTDTYSSAIGPLELPFGLALFVRFFTGGSWTSGRTCAPSFARTKNAAGQLYVPKVQDPYE